MAGKSRRKKTTAADLPEELIRREILTRLPAKSVARFKCVSKSWLSLFSEPQFVKQHITYSATQTSNDYDCLMATRNLKLIILSRDNGKVVLESSSYFDVIGSVRGIVCLTNSRHMLSLWNPATQQSKEISAPARLADRSYDIGFGYDHVSDIYKLVMLSADLRSATVYDSNSDNWIDISIPDNVFNDIRGNYFSSFMTIVKDCPYWSFHRYMTATAVKFDAGHNEFKLLPEFLCDQKARGFKFVDMNDCLTLIVTDIVSEYEDDFRFSKLMFNLFSLDGEEGSCAWTKMYTIGPFDQGFVVLQGFYGGEIVFDNSGEFCCYDRKTDTIYKLLTTTSATASRPSCFRYTPSLAFIEGMKPVLYSATRARRASVRYSRVPHTLIKAIRYH